MAHKSIIQRELQNRLASQILAGTVKDGDRVRVGVVENALSIGVEHADTDATHKLKRMAGE